MSGPPRSTVCIPASRCLTGGLEVAGPVFVNHGPARTGGPGRLRHGQRGPEQTGTKWPGNYPPAGCLRSTGGPGTAAWSRRRCDDCSSRGIGVIPLEAGAEYLLNEIHSSDREAVEVVVLSRAQTTSTPAREEVTTQHHADSVISALPVVLERRLDLADYPILESHVLDGRPVLPAALILEWLAHRALHHNPGLLFHGCGNLRVLHGVILDEESPPLLRIAAGKAVKRDGAYVATVEMTSSRPGARDVPHARAEVVLSGALPPAPPPLESPELLPYPYAPGVVLSRSALPRTGLARH